MTYKEMIQKVAQGGKRKAAHGQLVATQKTIEAFCEAVKTEVWRTGHFVIPGFVAFRTMTAKARKILNPVTGKPMQLPRTKTAKARVCKEWRTRA